MHPFRAGQFAFFCLSVCFMFSLSIFNPWPGLAGTGTPARLDPPSLNPARGSEIGEVYEAYLTPMQEGDDEVNTPKLAPATFRSTTPSKTRAQLVEEGHRGHGMIRFTRDLSRAYVDVKVEGVRIEEVNMFHIHCGQPGVLGPILVDFALITDIQENLRDGIFTVEVAPETIARTANSGHGPVASMSMGCNIASDYKDPFSKHVSTVAGMAALARRGDLYLNLHTTGQSFFGDMRGQVLPLTP